MIDISINPSSKPHQHFIKDEATCENVQLFSMDLKAFITHFSHGRY